MRHLMILALCAVTFTVSACQQGAGYGQNQKTYQGAATGAILGGIAGSLTGSGSTDRRQRAMIGAAAGAALGGGVGQYMDKQERAMRQATAGTGIEVQRQGDNILLNMPSSITFGVDQSNVLPQFYGTLGNIANVLNQYPETSVNIIGHTDSTGEANYNQSLSLRRANSVGAYLSTQGVNNGRLQKIGAGEELPIADNNTSSGRAANRRVEVKITPNTAG